MRICIVYDCLFPWTVGGAERWYRNLAERLAQQGYTVTYLTLRQWDKDKPPAIPGVEVIPVGPRMPLYHEGRRRIGPPLRFGWGVLLHLLWRGSRYDVVHTASFPFFSVLALSLVRPLHRFRVICDWHEVWSRAYWRDYLGQPGGAVGWAIQQLCTRVPQRAYTFSRLHADRLTELGLRGRIGVLTGEYAGNLATTEPVGAADPPVVVYAGRMIPEKRVPLLVDAIAVARQSLPQLRAVIFGRGPDAERIHERIVKLGLESIIELPGFVAAEDVTKAMARGLCVVQPSSREGYGMVVVEASAAGVPAVVIAGEDNAAVELIDAGQNGFIAPSADPNALAAEILRCWNAGETLRKSTREWYRRNAVRLSLKHSLDEVIDGYGAG
jgi:glycosyltransferase involved in cell wall biosynthesis